MYVFVVLFKSGEIHQMAASHFSDWACALERCPDVVAYKIIDEVGIMPPLGPDFPKLVQEFKPGAQPPLLLRE